MRGIWSQVITFGVILHLSFVSGKPLTEQNTQTQQQSGQIAQSNNAAQKRVGYDYPAPPHDAFNPFQDNADLQSHGGGHHDNHHEEHHEEHHHDHHDPGYWKKKLTWKVGWQKSWKPIKKQIWVTKKELVYKPYWRSTKKLIWVPDKTLEWQKAWRQSKVADWKTIWVPDVKKIVKPVWISEWFPSPDHHEHAHESHGWDRSDKGAAASQKVQAVAPAPQQPAPAQPQPFSK